MEVCRVSLENGGGYSALLVDRLLDRDNRTLVDQIGTRRSLLVTTPTVNRLYGPSIDSVFRAAGIDVPKLVVSGNERDKGIEQVTRICDAAMHHGLDRRGTLIALGGGIVLDLVTLAASLFRRGITHIRIPTSLVGQCDAGIGIKGAVNRNHRKSALGCFYAPEVALIDPAFLSTLPLDPTRDGIAEIVKIALVCDRSLFEAVEVHVETLLSSRFTEPPDRARQILWDSVVRMLEQLEPNIYEDKTYERLVDFGHTFSPVVESASDFMISHGHAVSIDMALTCEIARGSGHLDSRHVDRLLEILRRAGLPIFTPLLTRERCDQAMEHAIKHRGGALNLVLPSAIGTATFVGRSEVPDALVDEALRRLERRSGETDTARTLHRAVRSNSSAACLVFDIGGTSVRAGLYDRESATIAKLVTQPTINHLNSPHLDRDEIRRCLVRDMSRLGKELLGDAQPGHVSVAFPGPVDRWGRVLAAPTVWGPSNGPIELTTELREVWGQSIVVVLNDVTAAGYRYLQSATDDLCVVTVSSGIGQKTFLNGRPRVGPWGHGGEIGHWRVDFSPDAPVCDCGGVGHLGAIASGRGVLATAQRHARDDREGFESSSLGAVARSKPEGFDNRDIAAAFVARDPWTTAVVGKTVRPLAQTLAAIHLDVGMERFVIFGGFALALGERYRERLALAASECAWSTGQDWNQMVQLGVNDDRSGLVGAGRFVTEFQT